MLARVGRDLQSREGDADRRGSASYEVKDGQLRFARRFVQRAATIPADQYAQVRGFFERIRAAEQSPVVLAKR
jgi:hypothetical protein